MANTSYKGRRRVKEEPTSTFFRDGLREKMAAKGLDIRGLSDKLDMSYESVRKYVAGEGRPHPSAVKEIARILDWDVSEVQALIKSDRLRNDFGALDIDGTVMKVESRELRKIVDNWDRLTPSQQEVMEAQLDLYLARLEENNGTKFLTV